MLSEVFANLSGGPPLPSSLSHRFNAGALLLLGPWPFTNQLLEVTRDGMGDLVRLAITVAFVLGAIAGGVTAGDSGRFYPDLTGLGRRLAGGTLMGTGAALIPGGNDRLVLVDLPLLHVHGILAYSAMAAAIILGLGMNRWATKIARRFVTTSRAPSIGERAQLPNK